MDTNKINNPIVKAAIDALQTGDQQAWSALFAPDAEFFDDGNARSLDGFTVSAIGHERFKSIDTVENDGLDIYGQFHSDQWGDFKTYFKFNVNADNKITRLDIGQAF